MADERPLTFNLEVHCQSASKDMADVANLITADPQATIREKLLAKIALHQMHLFNQLVEALEYGTVTIRVNRDNVKRER